MAVTAWAATTPVTVAVAPPGLAVTLYEVIALPPVSDGAFQLTITAALAAMARTAVGGPGTVAGIATLDGTDGSPVPTELAAVTLNV